MSLKSTLETSSEIRVSTIKPYIVGLWGAAAKHESWGRTITILGALQALTDGDLFDEITFLLCLAFERESIAAQQVKQCGEFLDIDDGYECLEVSR